MFDLPLQGILRCAHPYRGVECRCLREYRMTSTLKDDAYDKTG